METNAKKENHNVDKVYDYSRHLLLKEGIKPEKVTELLVSQKVNPTFASHVVKEITQSKKAKAKKDMWQGALWCIGGVSLTFISYTIAQSGSAYVLTWGAIVFGVIQFLKGLSNIL